MLFGQKYHYILPSQTWVSGNTTTQPLKDLPKQVLGRLAHLMGFIFSYVFTPTYSGAPNTVGHNNVFTRIEWTDGMMSRFSGGGNMLRAMERLQHGRIRIPDADTDPASTNARYYQRVLYSGPPQFIGSPTDWVIPCGMLETGELKFSHGTLSDFQGTVSAATATVRVTAMLVLLDEIRIPPAYQFMSQAFSAADGYIAGQALYESIALMTALPTPSTFSAGDIAKVDLDMGNGWAIAQVQAQDLTASFNTDFTTGESGTIGDPANATFDDNAKIVNRGSPTALVGATADLQPILWNPPEARITKMWEAAAVMRLKWSGALTSAVAIFGRVLPQPPPVVAANIGKALSRIGATMKNSRIKTESKMDYKGRFVEYMPWKVTI